MKEIQIKRNVYEKSILDLTDFGIRKIDRTEQIHKYKFDIDIKSSNANEGRRDWIYWGSHHSVEKCINKINDSKSELSDFTDIRIVESKTGLIVKKFKI